MNRLASWSIVTFAALLAACDGKTSASSADASPDGAAVAFVPACAPAPSAAAPAARPDLREPRLTSLSRRRSSIVDVAPGRATDAEHPAGTVYVAAVVDNEYRRGEATLFEWDVASARPLDPEGTLLYRESDKEDNGKSADVRIATTPHGVFFAVTLDHGRFSVLRKQGYVYAAGSLPEYLPPARNISLEADERWLAVAYQRMDHQETTEIPQSGVLLYDAWTMKRVATFPFSQSREPGARYDILEILNGRLYAAEADETTLHVVELTMPALRKTREARVTLPKGSDRVQLTHVREHLLALTHDTVIELTPELEVVSRREVHADEVALGPAGELLTPLGLEGAGRRGDFVPDVRASASCTPSWAGAYPLLACSVDMEGVRIARLAPR